eukprot:scaffold14.g1163.t1
MHPLSQAPTGLQAFPCAPAASCGQPLAVAAAVRAWRERAACAAIAWRGGPALQLAVRRRRLAAQVAAANDAEADGPEQPSSGKRRYAPRGGVPDTGQDPRVRAELWERVGIASLSEVFHRRQPVMKIAPLLEYEAVHALLDYLLVELSLPDEAADGPSVRKLLLRAPQLLGAPGWAQMLFGGLAEFGVKAADAAEGLIKQPTTVSRVDWGAYRSSAALLDSLVQGRGGLAALMAKEPGSCMAAVMAPTSSLEQGLEWLRGRQQLGAEQAGEQPLMALSNEQVEHLVWQQPTVFALSIKTLRAKAALLHEVLGTSTEEASKIASSSPRYLTMNLADRHELLQWLAKFYGSQQAARKAVVKFPQLCAQQVATCQESVAALRRRLADAQQLSEEQPTALVLDVCTRQPAALVHKIDSSLMAAKLEVFAAAGYPPGVALGQHFGYLKSALRVLAVRLSFVTPRTQLAVKLYALPCKTAERLCLAHGLSHEDFLAYKRSYFDSPEWLGLCARHGLDEEGRAPRTPRKKRVASEP